MKKRFTQPVISRREFIAKSAVLASGAGLLAGSVRPAFGGPLTSCPVVVFSKLFQELKLDFDQAAAIAADAGLDGVDCPVRREGEIEPERAVEELPRYAETLGKRGLSVKLLTSGITSVSSPHAEIVLRTAKKLGIEYYRLGFFEAKKNVPAVEQAREIRAQLKDLAALNREIGICALFQNHSGSFGADLSDLYAVIKDFNPREIGVAFDLGHAIVAHGTGWRSHFEQLKSKLKVAYVKDVKSGGGWVRFGQGEIPRSGYFKLLKDLNYSAPFSLHVEFDWSDNGRNKNVEAMRQALKESNAVLRRWIAEA